MPGTSSPFPVGLALLGFLLCACSSPETLGGNGPAAGSASGGVSSQGNTLGGAFAQPSGGTSTGGNAAGMAGASGTSGAASPGGGGSGGADSGGNGGGSGQAGAAATLCQSPALVCEDFEDGNWDGWNLLESGGTLAIDATRGAHGTSSLAISIPGNERGGFLERTGLPLFPLPDKLIWGRLMIYFESVPDGHTDIIRGAAEDGDLPTYNVGEQHGEILLNYYNGASQDCWARPNPGKDVPLDVWMCWEWSFDGNANEMQFFIDGQLSRKVTAMGDGCLQGNPTWVAPDFATIRIGAYIAQVSNTPSKMWIDDIAIGTEMQLGCPAPL